jgi:hypothetical protein
MDTITSINSWNLDAIYCTMLGHWLYYVAGLLMTPLDLLHCLFTTPLVIITISLLQWVLTLWCLVSERSFDLFFRMLAADWLTLKVKVKVTLRLTVSQSVNLGIEPHLGPMTRYLFLSDSYVLVSVGRPLWREDVSVVCMCRWPLPAQPFSGPSPLGLVAVFYCLRFETSIFVASYDSQDHGGGIYVSP